MKKLLGVVIGVVFSSLVREGQATEPTDEATLKIRGWRRTEEKGMSDCFRGIKDVSETQTAVMVLGKEWQMWNQRERKLWTINGRGILYQETTKPDGQRGLPARQDRFRIKQQCRGLWLTAIARGCAKSNVEKADERKGEEWCKLLANGDGDGNIALRCNSSDHNAQFTELSKLVKEAEESNSDTTVIFKGTDTQQSFLCALNDSENSTTATEKMPDYKQEIGGQDCKLDETDPKSDSSDSCHYDMLWLKQKVASYKCPIRKPQNCSEAIKREYERGNGGKFGKSVPKIDEKTENALKLIPKDGNCTLKAGSKAVKGSVPARFELKGTDAQKGEIWCTLSEDNTITCRLVPQCEVEITAKFDGQPSQNGINSRIDYNGESNAQGLPKTCKPKGGLEIETGSAKRFEITDSSDSPKQEIWCISSGNKITCRSLSQCEAEVAGKFPDQWENIAKKEQHVVYKGERNILPQKCTPKGSDAGSAKKFESKDNGGEEFWCVSSGNQITCRHLSPCEAEVAEKFRDQWEKIAKGEEIKYEDGSTNTKLPDKCNSKGDSTNGATQKFTPNDNDGKQIWCTSSEGDGISCKLLTPCEVKVREVLKNDWTKEELDQKIDYKGAGSNLPEKCESPEGQSVPSTGGNRTFENTDPKTNQAERFSCKAEGPQITCTTLPPTCQETVRKNFEGCDGQKKVEFVEHLTDLNDKGNAPGDICPLDVSPPKDPQSCGDGKEVKLQIAEKSKKNPKRKISCKVEGPKISCKLLPRTCTEQVKEDYEKKCHVTEKDVKFGGDIQSLQTAGGNYLEDNCPLKVVPESQEGCQNGPNPLKFKITSGKDAKRKIFCNITNGKIHCDLLPRTCNEYVRHEFKEKCKKGNAEAPRVDFKEATIFSTTGGTNLTDYCPLEHIEPTNPKHQDVCKSGSEGNSLVFKINSTDKENRDILCNFTASQISCSLVNLTCAQTIQETFQRKILHSSEDFSKNVVTDEAGGKIGVLNDEKCVTTKEKNEDAEKTFKLTSGTKGEKEILCKKNEDSKITCTLLPPRCEVVKYENVKENPLRCKENENITISGGTLEEPITCNKEGPKNNAELSKKCKITVKNINGEGSKTYYCNSGDKDKLGDGVCTKIDKIPAIPCNIRNLNFDNEQCKNTNGDILIPKSLFRRFQEEMKKNKG